MGRIMIEPGNKSSVRVDHFDTGTVELEYFEGPANGPPFVILHGGSASWSYASALIDLLTDSWHVFAPDLRGNGGSGRAPGQYRVIDYAADIERFLDGVVREPAVLYGHSLGGQIAVVVAAMKPSLVKALIVGDAPLTPDNVATETPAHRSMNELWRSLAGRPEPQIQHALREMPVQLPGSDESKPARDVYGDESPWFAFQARNLHQLDPDVLAAVLAGPDEMLAGYSAEHMLPRITCQVLLLLADPRAGTFLTDSDIALACRLLPCPTCAIVSGVGHELHGTQPERVIFEIDAFLSVKD